MRCEHYYISGQVQGVFYRASTYEAAQSLKLTGWVKNLFDGRVEVLACGNKEQLAKLKAWLEKGPPLARVDKVEVTEIADLAESSVLDADGFEIKY